jgi:multicomponent Na+:H+ antiporter subunit D
MTPAALIWICLLIPLVTAAIVFAFGKNPNLRDGLMVACAATLFPTVLSLWSSAEPGGTIYPLVELFPGVPLAFTVEPLGLLFALVASALWPVTAVYGVGYLRGHHEHDQTRFFVWFSTAISATLGVAFSANLLTLFVCYEALTLTTWPLVTHHQDEEARNAGRIYLGILLTTSVCFLLLGIGWVWVLAGTLDFTPGGVLDGRVDEVTAMGLLALFAFGIGKAGLMPFHRWLPAAMVAPTPVSALLHAVAVVKAGVFSVLKVVVYIFGLDFLTRTGASVWLMYVAAWTILAASFIALYKDNLKERLAYSTIGQLAYIVLGAALANPAGVVGGSLHIAMHAFGKITLFFCAGAIFVATHKKKVSELQGLGRVMPLTFGAFTVGAISVIGLPPMGGSWSKLLLVTGAAGAGQPLLVGVLMLSSLLNVFYLMDVVAKAFFLPPLEDLEAHGYQEASPLTLAPPLLTAACCVLLFFFVEPLYLLLRPLGEV